MRCNVCDGVLVDVEMDKDHKVLPCSACRSDIRSIVDGYEELDFELGAEYEAFLDAGDTEYE